MEFILECSCGSEHRVSKKQAGQELTCGCGATVKIPTLRGFSDLRPAVEEPANEAAAVHAKTKKSNAAWSGWRSPAIALSALIMLIALAATGFWALQATRNDLGVSTEDFIAGGNEAIASYGPSELSIAWDDFQKVGLKDRAPPTFHIYNVYVEEQWIKVRYGSLAAGIAAAITGLIWLSALFTKS